MTWEGIKHFTPGEFACRCGQCGSDGLEMDWDFIVKLDQLRERLAVPFRITSGYRCPDYNDAIATTGRDGPHTTGHAADILMAGPDVFRLIRQCSLGGWMTGIGLNQRGDHAKRFVHLDDLDTERRPWVWTY